MNPSSEQHLPTSCEAGSKVSIHRHWRLWRPLFTHTHKYTAQTTRLKYLNTYQHHISHWWSWSRESCWSQTNVLSLLASARLKFLSFFYWLLSLFLVGVWENKNEMLLPLSLFLPFFNSIQFYPWCCSSKSISIVLGVRLYSNSCTMIISILLFVMYFLALFNFMLTSS